MILNLLPSFAAMNTSPRHSPLLDHPGPTRSLAVAPAPWDVRQCLETGLVYLANPPAQERFEDEFAWEVTHAAETERRRRDEPLIHAMSTGMKTLRRRWLKRDKLVGILAAQVARCRSEKIRVIDIGCSDGDLFRRLAARLRSHDLVRVEPVGIEISRYLAAQADQRLRKHGGRCIHASGLEGLEEIPVESGQIAVLSCILEHEISPVPLLAACRDRIAADGVIVIKVPNYACFGRRVRGRRWCGYRWPDHVNYFTPESLTATAERAGLRVARMTLLDRSPLSDSLYAVLARPAAASRHAKAA